MKIDEIQQSASRSTETEIYNMILSIGLDKTVHKARFKLKTEIDKFLNNKTIDEEAKAYHEGIAKTLTEFIMRHTTHKPIAPDK